MAKAPFPRLAFRRDAILDLLRASPRAMHTHEIATKLEVPERQYGALQRALDDLSFDGSIVAVAGQKFRAKKEEAARGREEIEGLLGVNPRGFGFLARAKDEGDVFIPAESMRGAMHGDRVAARIVTRSRRGVEGEVLRVLVRRSPRVAGALRKSGKSAWLEPDDARIRGPIVLEGDARSMEGNDGDAIVATITRWPESPDENPEARLEVVLGKSGEPKVEVLKILAREGIEEAHSREAIGEAERFGAAIPSDAREGREDLTGVPLPTIDPEDARDHDDAVWAVRTDDGSYRAWIAIADVSHYVRPETALDREAMKRGNSIYLPDRAIPMLPRALSSNLCSLLPNEDRLCVCAIVDLDATGAVTSRRLVEGVMRSRAKLTYPGVARALGFTSEPPKSEEAEAIREDLRVLWDLSRVLRARRMRRGALDFDLPEAKVILDEQGAPIGVEKRSHDPGVVKAYQLIEELMLLANETVAEILVERDVPTVFRDHGAPDEQKLERFVAACAELDVKFELDEARDPKKLSSFLKRIATHPRKHVLHMLLLRAMKQAYYDVDNIGHFGLASSTYVHFTSPIRRYPDVLVHRGVKALLRREAIDRSDAARDRLRQGANAASDAERKAMEIEREVVDLHRAIFMKDKIGAVFSGVVTALVASGVYVNVDSPFVDVLVKTDALGSDDYRVEDDGLSVTAARSGDRIALGDEMTIVIEDVNVFRRAVFGRRISGEGERRVKRPKKERRDGGGHDRSRGAKTTKLGKRRGR